MCALGASLLALAALWAYRKRALGLLARRKGGAGPAASFEALSPLWGGAPGAPAAKAPPLQSPKRGGKAARGGRAAAREGAAGAAQGSNPLRTLRRSALA